MSRPQELLCPDCDSGVSRRSFLNSVSTAAVAAGAATLVGSPQTASAAPKKDSKAEAAVGQLYKTLSDDQKKQMCFDFKHPLRFRVNANWHIAKPKIGDDFYTNEQRWLVDEILRGVLSADGYDRVIRQTKADAGGVGRYSMAIFGKPGTDQFQWEMTGRHLTLRADGNSASGAAFGGPLVYGHGVGNPSRNLYYYQTEATNKLFKALDEKQAKKALVETSPDEDAVTLQGEKGSFPGISVAELADDQQELVENTVKTLLAPYREEDVDEVMAVLKKGGGLARLHMSFYSDSDLEGDRIWDVWRVEGPSFVWHFRGDPHVHAYINIGIKSELEKAPEQPRRRRRG